MNFKWESNRKRDALKSISHSINLPIDDGSNMRAPGAIHHPKSFAFTRRIISPTKPTERRTKNATLSLSLGVSLIRKAALPLAQTKYLQFARTMTFHFSRTHAHTHTSHEAIENFRDLYKYYYCSIKNASCFGWNAFEFASRTKITV